MFARLFACLFAAVACLTAASPVVAQVASSAPPLILQKPRIKGGMYFEPCAAGQWIMPMGPSQLSGCAAATAANVGYTTLQGTASTVQAGLDAGLFASSFKSLSKSAAYSLTDADCGYMVTLSGAAFYQLSVGAAAAYPASCAFVIVNGDTGRAKRLALVGATGCMLWPGQSARVASVNGSAWAVSCPGRWVLPGPTTISVDVALGSNSNADGLSTGTGAFASFAGALSVICSQFDIGQQQLIVQGVAGQTHQGTIQLCDPPGSRIDYAYTAPILRGSPSGAAADSTLICDNKACVFTLGSVVGWKVGGFTMTGTGFSVCISVDNQARFYGYNNNYMCPQYHFLVAARSTFEQLGSWTHSGSVQQAIQVNGASMVILAGSATFSNASTPGAWVNVSGNSIVLASGATYSGKISNSANCWIAGTGGGFSSGGKYIDASAGPCATVAYSISSPAWGN